MLRSESETKKSSIFSTYREVATPVKRETGVWRETVKIQNRRARLRETFEQNPTVPCAKQYITNLEIVLETSAAEHDGRPGLFWFPDEQYEQRFCRSKNNRNRETIGEVFVGAL